MVFSSKDNIFIKNLVLLKGYSSRRLIKEFPQKGWNKNGLNVLLRKIRKTASMDRQPGSGRPCLVRTPENIGTWGEGQWRILQEFPIDGEDVASDLGDVKRLLHLPAGPRPSTSSKGYHCFAAT